MHDVWIRCGDAEKSILDQLAVGFKRIRVERLDTPDPKHLLGHTLGPNAQVRCASHQQIVGYRRKMMDETEFVFRIFEWWWRWEDLQVWIREAARLLPEVDSRLASWRKKKRWLLWAMLTLGVRSNVLHVVASDLMFRTISTR